MQTNYLKISYQHAQRPIFVVGKVLLIIGCWPSPNLFSDISASIFPICWLFFGLWKFRQMKTTSKSICVVLSLRLIVTTSSRRFNLVSASTTTTCLSLVSASITTTRLWVSSGVVTLFSSTCFQLSNTCLSQRKWGVLMLKKDIYEISLSCSHFSSFVVFPQLPPPFFWTDSYFFLFFFFLWTHSFFFFLLRLFFLGTTKRLGLKRNWAPEHDYW